ncbi:hypothetical protein ACH49M_12385 [Rhodococcus qingshengii]|uniref:hypothetical protein n=1 Tax=Rhodococcus qingshengii TaxID=334542 RepID=UPI0036FF23ED
MDDTRSRLMQGSHKPRPIGGGNAHVTIGVVDAQLVEPGLVQVPSQPVACALVDVTTVTDEIRNAG